MGRGEWVGGIDGERGFFFLTFQPTFYGAAFKTVKERGSGGIDGIVGGSHGRGEWGWVGWRERERS